MQINVNAVISSTVQNVVIARRINPTCSLQSAHNANFYTDTDSVREVMIQFCCNCCSCCSESHYSFCISSVIARLPLKENAIWYKGN